MKWKGWAGHLDDKAFPRAGRAGRGCHQADQKVTITPIARACDAIASAKLVAASNIFMVNLHWAERDSPASAFVRCTTDSLPNQFSAIRKSNRTIA